MSFPFNSINSYFLIQTRKKKKIQKTFINILE